MLFENTETLNDLKMGYGVTVSTSDSESESLGSNPGFPTVLTVIEYAL